MRGVAEILLRRGTPDDAETLFAIHRESAIAAYVDVFPPDRYAFPEEQMRRHWIEALSDPDQRVLIAEREALPVGFATVSPGWLRNFFVVPDEWGHGVAPAIHEEAVRILDAMGAGAHLWVLEANERARRFYERHGWQADGERGRSEYPPYPPTLRYELDPGAGGGPTHP